MMSHLVFGPEWAVAYGEALAASDAYRVAAKDWEGSVLLEMSDGTESGQAVFLDLWHGECRAARVATVVDREQADFHIRGARSVWERVLAGGLEPIFGLMTGKLKLVRGKLSQLVPYTQASKELVTVASTLDSRFPDARGVNDGT